MRLYGALGNCWATRSAVTSAFTSARDQRPAALVMARETDKRCGAFRHELDEIVQQTLTRVALRASLVQGIGAACRWGFRGCRRCRLPHGPRGVESVRPARGRPRL